MLLISVFAALLCAGCRDGVRKPARVYHDETGSAAGESACNRGPCPDGMCYVPGGQYTLGMTAEQAARLFEACMRTADQKWGDVCDRSRLAAAVPQTTVQIHAFCMDRIEVTQTQYQSVMKENPSTFRGCGGGCPVETVSWKQAVRYCETSGRRLPSGEEWEAAARGAAPGDAQAWTRTNSEVSYANSVKGHGTHPAAQKQPNAFGLYDMLGSVYEWTRDCRGGAPAKRCGVRGGSWFDAPQNINAAARHDYDPDFGDSLIGFRCAQSAP